MVNINPTTFEIVLSTKFERGDILRSYMDDCVVLESDNCDVISSIYRHLVQPEVEIRHLSFLLKYNLI